MKQLYFINSKLSEQVFSEMGLEVVNNFILCRSVTNEMHDFVMGKITTYDRDCILYDLTKDIGLSSNILITEIEENYYCYDCIDGNYLLGLFVKYSLINKGYLIMEHEEFMEIKDNIFETIKIKLVIKNEFYDLEILRDNFYDLKIINYVFQLYDSNNAINKEGIVDEIFNRYHESIVEGVF